MKDSNININVGANGEGGGKTSHFLNASRAAFNHVANAKWRSILKVYIVTFFFLATAVMFVFAYTASKDSEVVKSTADKIAKSRKEENLRDFVVTPKIQHELQKLVYIINADRAFLFELHNGKKNTTGLPFRFADMSYEEVNDEKKADKVAMQFQDIPLTLYKYPHYLQKQKMMLGTAEEISLIDADYAKHISDVGGKYLGMVYLSNRGIPLGFLCVSYHKLEDVPTVEFIERKLNEYGSIITQLLDLEVQIKDTDD